MTKELTDNKKSLNIIKLLLNKDCSKDFIMDELKIKPSTFYKYLNLIKESGFQIEKENNVFRLLKYKNLFKFAQYELSMLSYLLLIVYVMFPKDKLNLFDKVVEKMLCMTNLKDAKNVIEKYEKYRFAAIGEHYSEKISILKKYINDKSYAQITLKNSSELNVIPYGLIWKNNKAYLEYYDENEEIKNILLDNIIQINESRKEIKLSDVNETIFELYGKLSKSYLLKENERIIDFAKDKIVVANANKDKEKLFKRLLRYDIFCKVIFPKSDSLKFKTMIEKSLANIEKIADNI